MHKVSLRHGSALVYRDGMGVLYSITYIHLKNPISTPNENWGRKVGVIKNMFVYENGKGVKIVKKHFHNTCCCRCCRSVPHA